MSTVSTKSKVIFIRANDETHTRLDYICEVYALNRQDAVCRLISDTYNRLQDKKNFDYDHAKLQTLPSKEVL